MHKPPGHAVCTSSFSYPRCLAAWSSRELGFRPCLPDAGCRPDALAPSSVPASKPDNSMISEGATFNQQSHCHVGCVSSRCRKALEKSLGGGVFIQMHRLWAKFRCKALDV